MEILRVYSAVFFCIYDKLILIDLKEMSLFVFESLTNTKENEIQIRKQALCLKYIKKINSLNVFAAALDSFFLINF